MKNWLSQKIQKSWVVQNFIYDLNPTPENFIRSKWLHYHFCKNGQTFITPAIYLDNLAKDIEHESLKFKSANKKSLICLLVKKILESNEKKNELIALFEKHEISNGDIQAVLNQAGIADTKNHVEKEKQLPQPLDEIKTDIINSYKEEEIDDKKNIEVSDSKEKQKEENENIAKPTIHMRTYFIATHLLLELQNDEAKYISFTYNAKEFKDFIIANFKAETISEQRLGGFKNFSYKEALKGNQGKIGQMKPQFKQIVENPELFGKAVSEKANKIIKEFT